MAPSKTAITQEATPEENNDLVATPATAETVTVNGDYKLYRLTYDDVDTKKDLGFYLGVVDDIKDGSKLNATPGKAYLKAGI